MNSQKVSVDKLLSFSLNIDVGFIPGVEPLLSAGISYMQEIATENEYTNITQQTLTRLKEDTSNLERAYIDNLQSGELTKLEKELPLNEFFVEIIGETNHLNLAEKALVLGHRIYRAIEEPVISEDNELLLLNQIYDFLLAIEARVWFDDNIRLLLYSALSLFFRLKIINNKLALHFSIKAIESTSELENIIGTFYDTYLPAWVDLQIINFKENVDSPSIIRIAWASIYSLEQSLESLRNSPHKEILNSHRSSAHILNMANLPKIANSREIQEIQLLSSILCLATSMKIEDQYIFLDLILRIRDDFYDAYKAIPDTHEGICHPEFRHKYLTLLNDLFGVTS